MATSESPQPDHYATLGLSPDATSQEVENAFHSRVREHLQHANVGDKPIRERARQVGLAYETLRDPAKRRAYDESLAQAATPAPASEAVQAPRLVTFTPPEASERAKGKIPPLTMFTPPEEAAERPADTTPAWRNEPVPAEPEPEPEVPAATSEPIAASAAAMTPMAVDPIIEQSATGSDAPLAEPSVAPSPDYEPAERNAIAATAASSEIAAQPYEEPAPSEPDVVPWQGSRRRGLPPPALAAIGLVLVLGVGGLVLASLGSRSQPARVEAVLPVATGPASSGSTGAAPNVAPAGNAPAAAVPSIGETSAIGTPPPAATTEIAANTLPSGAALTAKSTPPAATVQVKLPPATPSAATTVASTAATAESSPPAPAAAAPAPPPAPAPAPPAPAPVQPARSSQPFPRWLGGGLMNSDNARGQYQGTVAVRFTVGTNGRVSDCRPVATSGNPALDATTCNLVEQRLQFSPALNAQGQPISTEVRTTYTWGRTARRRK